jgi:hypothetical protein
MAVPTGNAVQFGWIADLRRFRDRAESGHLHTPDRIGGVNPKAIVGATNGEKFDNLCARHRGHRVKRRELLLLLVGIAISYDMRRFSHAK